jgi:hypothetical protein
MLRMLCYAVAATASAFSSSVLAKDAGDFKGLSIDVNWSTVTTFRRDDGMTGTSKLENRGIRMYIGLGGHIFEYGGFLNHWGYSVKEFGKARTYLPRQMVVTTVLKNQLTRIYKLTRGFNIQTIVISPSRDSCTFSDVYKPDASGQLMGFNPNTNKPYELISRTLESYTCVVKVGNIFSDNR